MNFRTSLEIEKVLGQPVLHQQAHARRALLTSPIIMNQETPTLITIIIKSSTHPNGLSECESVGEEHTTKAACVVLIETPTKPKAVPAV